MTRTDLIKNLSNKYPELSLNIMDELVKYIFTLMSSNLEQGQRIEIRGFGSFSIRNRKPRITRNPKTGESISKGHKKAVHFKPGKELRERVNIYLNTLDLYRFY